MKKKQMMMGRKNPIKMLRKTPMETMKKNRIKMPRKTPMKMMKKNPMMTPNLTKTLNRRHRGIRLGSRNVMSLFSVKTINGEKCVFPFRLGLGTPEEKWYLRLHH